MKSTDPKVITLLEEQKKVDNHIAIQIRETRKARGLSMKQVANKIGVHPVQYANYENQKTLLRGGKIHAIASAIGVSAGDLYPTNDKTKNLFFLVGQQMRSIQEDADAIILRAIAAKKTAQDVEKLLLRV